MYCGACREERLTDATACAVCGAALIARQREVLFEELRHLQFAMADVSRWSPEDVPAPARDWIRKRYLRQADVLLAVLNGAAGPPPEQAQPRPAPPPPTASVAPPAPVASAPAPRVEPAPQAVAATAAPAMAGPFEPLPAAPRAEERVSRWETVWRPFLFESVGWFVGGFLILAGAFYFVADGWASAFTRSLVVFGVCSLYALGFMVWSAFLRRRPALESSGRVVGVIGAALAPFPVLALQPLGQVSPVLGACLVGAWSIAAGLMVRTLATAMDPPARTPLAVAAAFSTLALGLGPALAQLGPAVAWLPILPVACLWVVARAAHERTSNALAFSLLTPLYLALAVAIRIGLALHEAGTAVAPGTWAPLLSLAAAAGLAAMPRARERGAHGLEIAAVAVQLAALAASAFGDGPAFFVCSAALAFTGWTRARDGTGVAGPRLRWLYLAYFAGYFSWQSSGQLVPGFVKTLAAQVKTLLGVAATEPFPFNFGAVFALPYLLAGAVLALKWAERASPRARAAGEVLLRATAAMSAGVALLAFLGTDFRAGLWSVPVAAALCLGLGIWTQRSYLSLAGAALALLVPVYGLGALGAGPGAALACGVAVCLAVLSLPLWAPDRPVLAGAALAASLLALGAALEAGSTGPALLALLAGLAATAAARNHDDRWLLGTGGAVVVAAFTLSVWTQAPALAPLALAGAAAAAGALTLLGGRALALRPAVVLGALLAAAACLPSVQDPALPGAVLLASAAALSLAGRRAPWLHLPAAALTFFALLPQGSFFTPWPGLSVPVSLALYGGVALAASLLTARWGRGAGTVGFAAAALVGLAVSLVPAWLFQRASWSELVLAATLLTLLAVRALHPAVVLPLTAVLGAMLNDNGRAPAFTLLAMGLTAFALLDESAILRRHLFGGARAALPAAICAALALGVGALVALNDNTVLPPWQLPLLVLLPLLWTRATRSWVFLLLPLPLLGLGLEGLGAPLWLLLVPVAQVVLSRALAVVPFGARRERGELALVATGLLVLMALWAVHPELRWLGLAAAGALVLSASAGAGPRSVLAGLLAASMPGASAWVVGAAAALGLLAHHLPRVTQVLLGDRERPEPHWAGAAAVGAGLVGAVLLPGEATFLALGAGLLAAALLAHLRWLLVPALVLLALAPAVHTGHWLPWSDALSYRVAGGALACALLSLAFTWRAVREACARGLAVLTGWEAPGLRHPLWAASATLLALWLCGAWLTGAPPFAPALAAIALAASLGLLWTRRPKLAVGAGALLWLAALTFASHEWKVAVGGGVGALLCVAARRWLPEEAGRAVHHLGWVLALGSLALTQELGALSTPLALGFAACAAWAATRRRRLEALAWVATLVAAHGVLLHLGVVYSTGRGAAFILPYLGACSLAVCAAALWLAVAEVRRPVVLGLALLGALELVAASLLIPGPAVPEALVAGAALLVVVVLLVREAAARDDEAAGWAAQGLLLVGYAVFRQLGIGGAPGTQDALVALVGGALAAGLHAWMHRLGETWRALRRPLLGSALALPLAGLLAAPWDAPVVCAALLLAHAAHFSFLAAHRPLRVVGAAFAFFAFLVALGLVWWGTRVLEPQYFVIPAGLAALVLVKLFEPDLSLDAAARIRALAATAIYAAAAFRPLMFDSTWAMLVCVALCVVGIGAGVASRVRSWVYLGTAFMVTAVLANLIRHGVRDPRLGALFLSVLGLLIIVFMVLLSARRAELVERYGKLRHTLDRWQG